MLLDICTNNCRPGSFKKHPALHEKLGKGLQARFLDQLLLR